MTTQTMQKPLVSFEENISHFSIFAFLYAAAVIFHQAKWSYWLVSPLDFALSIAAFLVLLKPGSLLRFTAMLVLQLLETWQLSPWLANHWLFAAFVSMGFLATLLYHLARERSLAIDAAAVYTDFASIGRWQLIILYFFGVFHKLNSDFFDPALSCGVALYAKIVAFLPFLPFGEWAQYLAITGAVLIEAAIGVMLIFPKWRNSGIVIGILFHLLLGLLSYFRFAALIFAMYALFLPTDFDLHLQRWVRQFRSLSARLPFRLPPWQKISDWSSVALLVLAAIIFAIGPWTRFLEGFMLVREAGSGQRTFFSYVFQTGWLAMTLALLWIFLQNMRSSGKDFPTAKDFFRIKPLLFIFPLLTLLNGFAPYLGIKTETSFAMYSNLRTELGESNHYIVRKTAAILNYQNDLIRIVQSSDPELQKLADRGYLIPRFELRSYISLKKQYGQSDFSISYFDNEQKTELANALENAALSQPHPTLLRKLLYYRPVRLGEQNGCQH